MGGQAHGALQTSEGIPMMVDQLIRLQAYNRELVGSSVKTLAALQDHAQAVIRVGLENSPYLPEAGISIARQWASQMKERSDFCGRVMLDTCEHYSAFLEAWT
jgi:hypothetical protein